MRSRIHLRAVTKYWLVIGLSGLLAAGTAFLVAATRTPQFRSEARFLLAPQPGTADPYLGQAVDGLTKRSIVTTFGEVLTSRRILADAANTIGLPSDQVTRYSVSALASTEANVVKATLVGPDGSKTDELLKAVAQASTSYFRDAYRLYSVDALDLSPRPVEPFNPQPVKTAALAGALGVSLGVGLALLHLRRLEEHRVAVGTHDTEPTQPSPSPLALSAGLPALPPAGLSGAARSPEFDQWLEDRISRFSSGASRQPGSDGGGDDDTHHDLGTDDRRRWEASLEG